MKSRTMSLLIALVMVLASRSSIAQNAPASSFPTATPVYGDKLYLIKSTGVSTWASRSATIASIDDSVRHATRFSGADAGAKIAAAIADLPSTGGTVDATGFEGTQTISSDIFTGVTKSFTLFLGNANYQVTSGLTLAATNNVRIIGSGIGSYTSGRGTTLTWNGANSGTVLTLDRVRDSFFAGFSILPGTGSIGIAIRVDHVNAPSGGTLSTHNIFEDVLIDTSTTAVQIGNSSTANNDLHEFRNVYIYGTGTYGYYINDAQSKFIRIQGGQIAGRSSGIYTVRGSYTVDGVNFSQNGIDNNLGNPTDRVAILNSMSEEAVQFINDHVGGDGSHWPVSVIGNRVDTASHGGAGFLTYKKHGPFVLMNNEMADGLYTAAVTFDISSPNGTTVFSSGNVFPNGSVWGGASQVIRRVSLADNYMDTGGQAKEMDNIFGVWLQLGAKTFSALTACSASLGGSLAYVTDSNTSTDGATIAGGGSNKVLALCDGTNWVKH